MTLSRLFVPVLLILSASAFAQTQNASSTAAPSEPWKITSASGNMVPGENPLDRMQIDQFKIAPKAPTQSRLDPIVVTPENMASDAGLCYTIRSYVVARDSKHSDSVHPVGYSTCQPAGRYRLKTADMNASGR